MEYSRSPHCYYKLSYGRTSWHPVPGCRISTRGQPWININTTYFPGRLCQTEPEWLSLPRYSSSPFPSPLPVSLAMRFFFTAAAAAAFALACSAVNPTPSSKHTVHEKRDGQPHAWQKRHRALADHVMPIRIALRERNIEKADSYILDVADPKSPNFGEATVPFFHFSLFFFPPNAVTWNPGKQALGGGEPSML